MRIGLIGWYGHANAGDERILYCLRRFLADDELFITRGFGDAIRKLEELNRCDYILLGGGGLIMRGFGIYAPLFRQLRARFGCVGVSVEALHKDNRALVEAIKQKAEFILVRDEGSRRLLGEHPKVRVGPDLSFLYPFDVVELPRTDTCGVNLRNWYYWGGEHLGSYYYFMEWASARISWLPSVYPFRRWEPERAMEILKCSFARLAPIPLYAEEGTANDVTVLGRFFDSVGGTFSPGAYSACDYVVGMRLHFVIFACQMGVPFISLAYMPKNREFCEAAGMGRFCVDLFGLAELRSRIEEMKGAPARLREGLLDFRRDQEREIHSIMRELRAAM